MGKGNRSRLNRASDILAESASGTAAKRDNTKTITVIVSILVAALLIACLVLSYVVSSGVLVRSRTAVKSDNYRISGSLLTYYFYSQYQSFLSTYGSYASYFGLDTSKSLKNQNYSDDLTWYDYFMNSTASQLVQIVALCEGARAEGVELDEEDKKSVDEVIESLESYAKENSMTVSTLLSKYYGRGVTIADVRKATEMSTLASKYMNKLGDDFKAALTDEEIEKYVDDHKSSFLSVNVLKYTFKAELKTEGAEATEAEMTIYEGAKTAMNENAEALKAAAVGEDEFKAWMVNYLCGDLAVEKFNDAYAEQSKSLVETDRPSDEVLDKARTDVIAYLRDVMEGKEDATAPTWPDTTYNEALGKVVTSVYGTLVTNGYNTIISDGIAYSDPAAENVSELNKWLFNSERAAGDTFIDKTEGDTSSTYSVYYMTKTLHRNENGTVNAAHILVSAEKTSYNEDDTEHSERASEAAKAKAEEILAEYEAGEHTFEAFEALGKKYTEDSNVLYEDIKKGDMVEEFENWIFDEARKEGDTGIVKTTYGYHVMFFKGAGDAEWRVDAKNGVIDEKLTAWYEEAEEKYHVTCDTSKLTFVDA